MYPNSILDILAWIMDHSPQRKWDANAYLQKWQITVKASGDASSIMLNKSPVGLNDHVLFYPRLVHVPTARLSSLLCQISSDKKQLKWKAKVVYTKAEFNG